MNNIEGKKKNVAIVFCLTKQYAFAVACVMMDIQKYSPDMADEVVIFHDGIEERDQKLISHIMNTRFIVYEFPIKDTSIFDPNTLKYFTKMVFAKFEPLKLLDEFENIILLDYDIKVQGDLGSLLLPSRSGLKAVISESKVVDGLHKPVVEYDMNARTLSAGVIVFQRNLKNYDRLYKWCYEKTEKFAKYLYLPEQAIFDFMVQDFNITVEEIDSKVYCCHPANKDEIENAKIIHCYGQPKFWNGVNFPAWNKNYGKWLNMGGSRFVHEKKSLTKTFYERLIQHFNSVRLILVNYMRIFRKRNELTRHSKLLKYFDSPQYLRNTWTLRQCIAYGAEFEEKYYEQNFINDYERLLYGLDDSTSRKFKFLYLRLLVLASFKKQSFFNEDEEQLFLEQERLVSSITFDGNYYKLCGFKFVNKNMTVHNFIDDMGLKKLETISSFIDKDIIDVGAYVGDSSMILSKYTNKKVHAFEPFDGAHGELIQNIDINKLNKKIIPLKLGLSEKCGKKDLFFSEGNLSISTNNPDNSLSKGKYSVKTIDVVTLDSYVLENDISIGVVKIDAEGAEREVLNGARRTILRDKPILLVSIYHNIDDFMYIKPWIDDLNVGYKYLITKPESTTFVEETMLVCYVHFDFFE